GLHQARGIGHHPRRHLKESGADRERIRHADPVLRFLALEEVGHELLALAGNFCDLSRQVAGLRRLRPRFPRLRSAVAGWLPSRNRTFAASFFHTPLPGPRRPAEWGRLFSLLNIVTDRRGSNTSPAATATHGVNAPFCAGATAHRESAVMVMSSTPFR